MSEFLQRVAGAIQRRQLFRRGQKILVAVSGGVDSMVLLHALHSLAAESHWKISVAHFNHHLRGRASDADQRLVQRVARQWHLPFLPGGADVKTYAGQAKISVEMAARKLRHEFLARTARTAGIPTVALAHHADDQVELFFLRLLRGTGGEGIAGTNPLSPSPADPEITLARPLLEFPKAGLLAVAHAEKIPFRHDATNFTSDFLRNRIRNRLLPLLRKQYQPALDKTVLRLMDIVGAEARQVRAAADQYVRASRRPRFDALPLAVQRQVVCQSLARLNLVPDFELVEQLREHADRRVSVGAGLTVTRDVAGRLHCQEESPAAFRTATLHLPMSRTGRGEFAGKAVRWRVAPLAKFQLPARPAAGHRECFDADKIGAEIVLRHWQPGDRFQPIGLKSGVKLQDLFVNAKIPAARRRRLLLAATGAGEIFWVEGLRIGECFKLTPRTRRKLTWQWNSSPE